MNKSIVRNSIESVKGKKLHFRYNGSRNQIEEFDGVIDDIYNSIFIIKLIDNQGIKSFTYNDIINESLQFFI